MVNICMYVYIYSMHTYIYIQNVDGVFQLRDPHTHPHNHSPLRTSQPPKSLSAAGSLRSWPL